MGKLDGRVALVKGASRGFGRAIALAYAREGAHVVVKYNATAAGAAEAGYLTGQTLQVNGGWVMP